MWQWWVQLVVGGGVHRRMGRRTAVITVHRTLRPGSTSQCENGKGLMAWPAHSPKQVVGEAEYVERLLVVSKGEI